MLPRGWLFPIAGLLLIFAPDPAAPLIEDAIEILQLLREVGSGIQSTWGIIADVEDIKMPKEKRLMSKLAQLSRRLDRVQESIDSKHNEMVSKLLIQTPQTIRLELRLNKLAEALARIKWSENTMRRFADDHKTAERLTLEQFARSAVAHEAGSINDMLDTIHDLVTPNTSDLGILNTGLMELLLAAMKESNNHLCELKQSPHQLLFNMYNTITLTEIKGYTTMQYSWMLLKLYGHGNFTTESNHMREKFEERSAITLKAVKNAMHEASREMWRCDPYNHKEGSTYVAVTRLLQGYIENEVDMNSETTCRENCAYYKHANNHGCFKDMFCSRQRPCSGDIHDCKYIDSDMTICPSQYSSTRRYDWIEYENGQIFGTKNHALRDPQRVVTGIRFVKKNRVIYLQISEGTLEPMGKINQNSVKWKPIQPVDIRGASNDYHTLVYRNRTVDLDDLEGPMGHVLTGVRFRMLGTHLNLEIMVTPFNFKTGKLTDPHVISEWISNDNTDASVKPRSKVELTNPDIPTKTRAPSIPDSISNQYIEFTHSSMDADVAQTTVPYLDAQIVMPAQAVPLSGAGIYHKGQKFFGGFIAPKVFTYDYSQHMEIVIQGLDNVIDE